MTIKLTDYHILTVDSCTLDFKSGAWTICYSICDSFLSKTVKDNLTLDKLSVEPWKDTPELAISRLVEHIKRQK